MPRQQINAKHLGVGEHVTASVTITLGELDTQLLDAGLRHREFIALFERDLLAERLLEQPFKVG